MCQCVESSLIHMDIGEVHSHLLLLPKWQYLQYQQQQKTKAKQTKLLQAP